MRNVRCDMKKIFAVLFTAALLAAPAFAQDAVYSLNVVGFQKTTLSGPDKSGMFSNPFETGELRLLDIFGTNTLTKGTTPAACDKIRFWDPSSQKYISVAQYIDGLFYLLTPAGAWDPGYIVTNPVVEAGTGFWITSATGSEGERLFTFVGDVIDARTNSVSLIAGYQAISYPFSSSLHISNAAFVASGATKSTTPGSADQIRVWNKTTEAYESYALYTDNQWYKLTAAGAWDPSYTVCTHIFEPGSSFLYYARSAFNWIEPSQYYDDLFN